MSTLAVVLATAIFSAPVNIHVTVNTLRQAAWKVPSQSILIAQKYGGEDPHGDDPHGDDPAEEQHDDKLPANEHKNDNKAPKDVYGGEVPNTQAPY